MQLTLGPVLYNWAPEIWRDFYFRIADEAPIGVAFLGEVVCSKRAPFIAPHLPAVVERLAAAGKQVIFSSLALLTLERERRQMAELAETEDFLVEVNDLSCIRRLAGRPHAIGPFINVYNGETAAFFARSGARRICLPPELPAASIAAVAVATPSVALEVFAFGRVPLAISARCYHARLHELTKDNCRFVCDRDLDGLDVSTLDGQPFLAVNGVQTLSSTCANLVEDTEELRRIGVSALRLSPQVCDMVRIARLFRDVLDGRMDAEDARMALSQAYPRPFSNGFLHGLAGVEMRAAQAHTPR